MAKTVDPATDLLTTREVMAALVLSTPSGVSKIVRTGKLTPAVRLPGIRGAMLFRRSDVEALAAERAAS
jgi:hypothetical protein